MHNFIGLWRVNIYSKDWRTYSHGTDRHDELCCKFSITNDLLQMVNFPTCISDSDSNSSLLLYLFLSSDTSICSTKAFFPFDHSDHVVVSISTDLLSNWKQDALFYGIVYDYSCGDCVSVCHDLRDVPWEDIFKLLVLSVHRNLYFFHFYQQKKYSESQKGY